MLDVRVCGGLEVEADGLVLPDALFAGRQGRLVFAYLVCERHRTVRREELAELLWPDRLPASWPASLSAIISRLRRLLGEAGLDGAAVLVSSAGTYQLVLPPGSSLDLEGLAAAASDAEAAASDGDVPRALEAAAAAEGIAARGFLSDDCEWADRQRDVVRDHRVRAALARSAAHLTAGSPARAVDAARDALGLDPSREVAFRQLMQALAAAGERGEALRVWEHCRVALAEELGIDPSPETEAVYLEILGGAAAPAPPSVTTALPSGVVTFLLTDIVESSSLWEDHPDAMATALQRHDTLVGEVVAAHGGTLLKSKLEGDATVSVFARATAGATAALAVLDALAAEPWPEGAAPRLRMAMHTGEAFERDGDYFGPALNRAARLRSLAGAGQVLLSQAVAELVRDHLPADVVLLDHGHRDLRGLSRGENVYELGHAGSVPEPPEPVVMAEGLVRPPVPVALAGAGPFVGRGDELARLRGMWDGARGGEPRAVFIGGEPGVGKSRLAGEIAGEAHAGEGLVLYGRCDEDLAAPFQPFIEAVRTLAPALGSTRLRAIRGIDELRRFVPELDELLPDAPSAVRADPDTERLALFDAMTQLLVAASDEAPVLLVLDDLHWAGKTTLSLLRHLLRGAKDARLLVIGTYRDTELARTHPLAATLADLRRDTDAHRIGLGGLGAADVEAYLMAIGNTDRALGRELAEVTSGNPFFLIEVVRHVEETGGAWERGSLPEGVREATGRRLSRLSDTANDALTVAAVVGASFDLALVEQVCGRDLIDDVAEACQAGLVIEEPGALDRFRFAHALVRQVLLAELVTLKRVRLHRTIAELLEAAPPAADPDGHLADLAYHWFECASMGGAVKAVEACQRAADRAMERLAYEEAGDLYGMALQALDAAEGADAAVIAEIHLARCDALLTAGDVTGARAAIDALELASSGSERLAAWYSTYEGLLAVLAEPDRLTEIVQSIGAAAGAMRAVGDLTGEAKAHYVHAMALERLGQIGSAERALDAALAAARGAGDRRLADAVLAEAPPAALWGPRPVTRASGSCLDVVRVLRITDGAPAVESVALRCQAVLEALRGRMEAARRMIGSSRRTVERLGLTHRRLETEVFAGFIELLDGQAAEAEVHLRAAYDELRDRGLEGEAAQAGAFLGRALLLQGRVEEADAVAAEAEALAGADLKAAIVWRGVRAETAARRGDLDRALYLAREAVDLATATDVLLLVADARLSLATVLRLAGDHEGADAEARRAIEACDAKGATVLAARAREALGAPEPADAAAPTATQPMGPGPRVATAPETLLENEATRVSRRNQAAYNNRDWDAIQANYGPGWFQDDRRSVVNVSLDPEQSRAGARLIFEGGGRFEQETIATRGRTLTLGRWLLTLPDEQAVVPVLILTSIGDDGLYARSTLFDADDLDGAFAELDARFLATEGAEHAPVLRLMEAFAGALEAHDAEAARATLGPQCQVLNLRSPVPEQTGDDWVANLAEAFTVWGRGRVRLPHIPRLSASGGVWVLHAEGTGHDDSGPVAGQWILVVHTDGRSVQRLDFYDDHQLQDALAAFDEANDEGLGHPFANAAWRAALRVSGACNARDWDAFVAALAPGFEYHDGRAASVQVHLTGDEASETYVGFVRTVAEIRWERALLATRDDRLALVRDVLRFSHGQSGPAEIECLSIVACDGAGLVTANIAFGPDQLREAYDELDAQRVALGGVDVRVYREAFNAQDWGKCERGFASTYAVEDERATGYGRLDHDSFITAQQVAHDLSPDVEMWMDHVVSRPPATLTVSRYVGTRDGGTFERPVIAVSTSDDAGRVLTARLFDIEDADRAWSELDRLSADGGNVLDARARELGIDDARQTTVWRAVMAFDAAANARDWDAFTAVLSPEAELDDRRSVSVPDGNDPLDTYRLMFSLDEATCEHTLLAARGDRLALTRTLVRFRDRAVGTAEVACLTLMQADAAGRITNEVAFDEVEMDAAIAELDARARELETETPSSNAAWRAVAAMGAAVDSRDWDAFTATLAPSFEDHDRRSVIGSRKTAAEMLLLYRDLFDLDEATLAHTLLATRGERLALVRTLVRFSHGDAGPAEVECLHVMEVEASGRLSAEVAFDSEDLEGALAELEARHAREQAQPRPNQVWAAVERVQEAFVRRDWDAYVKGHLPELVYEDRRPLLGHLLTGDVAIAAMRAMFDMEVASRECRLVASEGDRVAVVEYRVLGSDGAVGEIEVLVVDVVETADDGRLARYTIFAPDDLDRALDNMHERAADLAAREGLGQAPT